MVWFDYETFFKKYPTVLRGIQFLEWFYIPAHEFLMHGVMALTSFLIPQRRHQRARNLLVLLLRGGLFAALCWFAPRAAVLYLLAYCVMLTILRFMDATQHDYGPTTNLFEGERSPHRGDKEWEQAHTFSPMISLRYPLANLLVLNFSYHNAHHLKPTTPWFALPALHRQMFGDDPAAVIPLGSQLRLFHRFRVARVLGISPQAPAVEGPEYLRAAQNARVTGGNAVSFLTAF